MTHPCARSSGEGPAPRNSSMGHEGPATHGWIIQPEFHLPIRQTLRLDSWQHSRGTYQLAAQIIHQRLRPKHWQQYKQIQPELACRQGIWPAWRNALTTPSCKFTVDPRVLCLVQHRDRRPNEAWSPLLHKRKTLGLLCGILMADSANSRQWVRIGSHALVWPIGCQQGLTTKHAGMARQNHKSALSFGRRGCCRPACRCLPGLTTLLVSPCWVRIARPRR